VGSGLRVRFRRRHFQSREPKRQPRAAAQARLHVPVAAQELALQQEAWQNYLAQVKQSQDGVVKVSPEPALDAADNVKESKGVGS